MIESLFIHPPLPLPLSLSGKYIATVKTVIDEAYWVGSYSWSLVNGKTFFF